MRDLKSELTGDVRRNILLPSAVPTEKSMFQITQQKSYKKKYEPAIGELNIVVADDCDSEMILGI